MFIVLPKLSEIPNIYGIYSLIISFSIFFAYADFGFLGAGLKYASESFGRDDLEEEIVITGFACFILALFTALCALILIIVSFNPHLLVKGLEKSEEVLTASRLLLILAAFSPVNVFQRFFQIVFTVRVESYISQRIQIIASIIKILSVFYFFGKGNYDITGYYLFFQSMNAFAVFALIVIVKTRYGYDYVLLLRSFRFSKRIYRKSKKLAVTSLYTAATHILYYELDFIVIGQILGVERVAFYAIGFTIHSFVRSLLGTFFTPFGARFNHFIGMEDADSMRGFLHSIIVVTLPFVVFPLISMILLMKPLVFCWVGSGYAASVPVTQLLVMSFIYGSISYPAGSLLIAQERIKLLYISGAILPIMFWAVVISTISDLGITSFALSKFIAISSVNIIYLIVIIKLLRMEFRSFCTTILLPLFIPSLFLVSSLLSIDQFLPAFKDKFSLMVIILTGAGFSGAAILLYALFSEPFRNYKKNIVRKIFIKNTAS